MPASGSGLIPVPGAYCTYVVSESGQAESSFLRIDRFVTYDCRSSCNIVETGPLRGGTVRFVRPRSMSTPPTGSAVPAQLIFFARADGLFRAAWVFVSCSMDILLLNPNRSSGCYIRRCTMLQRRASVTSCEVRRIFQRQQGNSFDICQRRKQRQYSGINHRNRASLSAVYICSESAQEWRKGGSSKAGNAPRHTSSQPDRTRRRGLLGL